METGTATLRRWWSNKYKLPPNHELFTGQSHAELNQEMTEDLLLRKKEIEDELDKGEDPSKQKSRNEILLEQLNDIKKVLGEDQQVVDELVAYWDEQLERGEIPDLDMTLEDLAEARRLEKMHGMH